MKQVRVGALWRRLPSILLRLLQLLALVLLLHLFQSKARWPQVPDHVRGWRCVNVSNLVGDGDVEVRPCAW